MAGIVKSTKRRFLVGKRIKEVEVPGTELDTDLFLADLAVMGGDNGYLKDELSLLPQLVKQEAVLSLVTLSRANGQVRGFNGDTKSVELFSFERGSSGSTISSSGKLILNTPGTARLGHVAESGNRLGYLIEKASTNQCLYSEPTSLSQTFNPVGVEVTETDFGLGYLSSGILLPASVACYFRMRHATLDAGKYYTASIYVQRGDGVEPVLQEGVFELRIGNEAYPFRSTVSKVINSVYRISATFFTETALSENNLFVIKRSGIISHLVSGFQIEEGIIPTSYIPTDGSASIRLADKIASSRPIAAYPRHSFYMRSDRFTGWFGNGVDEVNVHGRNLLSASDFIRDTTFRTSAIFINSLLRAGDILTISVEDQLITGEDRPSYMVKLYDRDLAEGQNVYIEKEERIGARVFLTFEVVTGTISDYRYLRIHTADNSQQSQQTVVRFTRPKLERGPVATPWSPAPEDLVRIDESGNLTVESSGSDHLRSLSLVPRALTQEEI